MKRSQIITALAVVLFAFVSASNVRGAGSNAAEEAAIRKAIAALGQRQPGGSAPSPYLPDRIFWSGAYKRPVVGAERAKPRSGPGAVENRVPGLQKNKTEVIRIVVADGRDLAYTLEFDVKSGEQFSLDTGVLRVWQKQGGDWKIAAVFVRSYEGVIATKPGDERVYSRIS
jgi:hypothetical protein